jgi:protein TonB
VLDESVILHIRNRKILVKHLFRSCLIISFIFHLIFFGSYYVSHGISSTEDTFLESALDLEHKEIEIDIPPELIGGDSNPAPVEKQEWVEGKSKTGSDPEDKDINTNQISGDGTDKDGFLFSFKGDMEPKAIIDFDISQYYPQAAKAANISEYEVVVLLQIDENGSLVTSNIASGKAPYGFNDQALKIVKRARFSPGYKDGKRVKMAHYFTVYFKLVD